MRGMSAPALAAVFEGAAVAAGTRLSLLAVMEAPLPHGLLVFVCFFGVALRPQPQHLEDVQLPAELHEKLVI